MLNYFHIFLFCLLFFANIQFNLTFGFIYKSLEYCQHLFKFKMHWIIDFIAKNSMIGFKIIVWIKIKCDENILIKFIDFALFISCFHILINRFGSVVILQLKIKIIFALYSYSFTTLFLLPHFLCDFIFYLCYLPIQFKNENDFLSVFLFITTNYGQASNFKVRIYWFFGHCFWSYFSNSNLFDESSRIS